MITNKEILITAGPTWVAIDKVRVISNVASGETGFILAEKFKKLGAKVTLLLGPGNYYQSINGIKVICFQYFWQLKKLLNDELKKSRYDAVIHAAAVSDYQLKKVVQNKISSQLKNLKISLVPTEKLINSFKKYKKDLVAVGFKFESNATKDTLLKKALALLKKANLDFVVANSNKNNKYCAHILDGIKQYGPFLNKVKMSQQLSKLVIKKIL